MGVFFKFTNEGKILVAKTIHQSISDEEFASIAKEISKEDFLSRYSEERDQLEEELGFVKRIADLNLSIIGPVMQYFPGIEYNPSGCYIGDKYFGGFYERHNPKEQGLEYGYKFYGKEKMDELIASGYLEYPKILTREQQEKLEKSAFVLLHCFSGEEEIYQEQYFELVSFRDRLTGIRDAKNPLNKSQTSRK